MKKYLLVIGGAMISIASVAFLSRSEIRPSEPTWEDGFDDLKLDLNKWSLVTGDGCPTNCGFGNNELQFYTDKKENARIENGRLIIEAVKGDINGKSYSSAKLITKGKADWKFGRIEVRAKLPSGRGTWPAIWMMPTLKNKKVRWPLDGEIDIMEHVGYNQGMIYGTIHTKKYNHMIGTQRSDSILVKDAHENFHVYGIEWKDDQITWFVDDKEYLTLSKGDDDYQGWPFDENEYHLILNLAVGGNWGGKLGVDDEIWPQQMVIDYVKYYN